MEKYTPNKTDEYQNTWSLFQSLFQANGQIQGAVENIAEEKYQGAEGMLYAAETALPGRTCEGRAQMSGIQEKLSKGDSFQSCQLSDQQF